jgi:peroxiredoxin Q/BCP
MSQLRQGYSKFEANDTVILVVGPEGEEAFRSYWERHDLPFTGLPDPKHSILKLYGQQIKMFKFGRMPAQAIIDKNGMVRYIHYGKSMSDIPDNDELLNIIEKINREQPQS